MTYTLAITYDCFISTELTLSYERLIFIFYHNNREFWCQFYFKSKRKKVMFVWNVEKTWLLIWGNTINWIKDERATNVSLVSIRFSPYHHHNIRIVYSAPSNSRNSFLRATVVRWEPTFIFSSHNIILSRFYDFYFSKVTRHGLVFYFVLLCFDCSINELK